MFLLRPLVENKTEIGKKKNSRDQALANFVAGLKKNSKKPVVLMGDLNCARTPQDIYTTKGKEKSAGFTPEERESFERRILGQPPPSAAPPSAAAAGLRDVWRERNPERTEYTYWSYRGGNFPGNKGWRLDYTLVHPELAGEGRRRGAAKKTGSGNGNGSREDSGDEGGSDGEEDEGEGEEDDKKSHIHDVFHLQHVRGSDHCPIGVAIRAEGHGEELV